MVHSCCHFWCIPNCHFWCILNYRLQTEKRTHYEQDLQLEILGKMIRKVRLERNLTQEELGKLNTMAPLTGFTLTGNPEVKRLDILACHLAKETFLHQTHR